MRSLWLHFHPGRVCWQGLKAIHALGVAHGDLRRDNILVSVDGKVSAYNRFNCGAETLLRCCAVDSAACASKGMQLSIVCFVGSALQLKQS